VTVTITFLVTAAIPILKTNTSQLQFQYIEGTSNPPPQTIVVRSSTKSALSASITSSVSWLSLSAPSGVTPFNVNIQPDSTGLAIGTYTGTVVITDTSSATDVRVVNITLTVGQPPVTIANVTNAAIPVLDVPPSSLHLASSSLATIFGTNPRISRLPPPQPRKLRFVERKCIWPQIPASSSPVILLPISSM
jgi:hypothetical protein